MAEFRGWRGLLCLAVAWIVPLAGRAEPPAVGPGELGQASLQEAFRLLMQQHVRAEEIDARTVNQAALQGLLQRFPSSIELVEDKALGSAGRPATRSVPTLLERLGGGITYLRLSLADRVPEVGEMRQAIEGAAWLLLDLRVADRCDDFAAAARFLGCLAPAGEVLFELRGRDDGAGEVFRAGGDGSQLVQAPPVVVLVDGGTSPAAEVIAGWLGSRGGALVAGEPTAGGTLRFTSVPIAEGVSLRFAVAEVVLPGGATLHGRGVVPVLAMASPPAGTGAVFPVSTQAGVAATISQRQRPHLNEAALVTGIDPQLAAHLEAEQEVAGEEAQDVVLRQLVDLLAAIDQLGLRHSGDGEG